MTFDPDYGQTPLSDEEQAALTDPARELLGEPVLKADLYDLEQQIQDVVADEFVEQVLQGNRASISCSLTFSFANFIDASTKPYEHGVVGNAHARPTLVSLPSRSR